MEDQGSQTPELELAEKIIHLHDVVGLGFRRISQKLTSEGTKISKDTAFRLLHKYKKDDAIDIEEDEELAHLKETEKEAQKDLRLVRKREEVRRRIAAIAVEKAMTSFAKRKQLFSEEEELLGFAEKVMPIIDPMLWHEFKGFCEEQRYGLANAVATAIGEQRYFEDQLMYEAGEKQSLDRYLKEQIEESLNAWKEEGKEENSEPTVYEPDTIITIKGNDEEYITIPLVLTDEDSEYEEIVI